MIIIKNLERSDKNKIDKNVGFGRTKVIKQLPFWIEISGVS